MAQASSSDTARTRMWDLHRRQRPPGSGVRFRVLADKAYSHPWTRKKLRRRRISITIAAAKRSTAYRRTRDHKVAGRRH